MPRRPAAATLLAASLAIVAGAWFLLGPVAEARRVLTYGFPAYYTSSRLVLDGRWSPEVYDNAWMHRETSTAANGVLEIYRPNTPVMSLLALPVAGLDVGTARAAWLVLQVVLVAVLLGALLAALPVLRAPPAALGLAALVLAWAPLHDDVRNGQAYTAIAALQAVVLWAAIRGRPAPAGLALGVSIAAKLASIPVALVVMARGGWRTLGWAAAMGLVLVALTLPFAGAAGWGAFARALGQDTLAPTPQLAVVAFQSTTGFLDHLLRFDAAWNSHPILDLPWLASLLGWAATGVVLVVTVRFGRRAPIDLAIAAAIVAGLLVLNLAQEYHGAMLLVPAAVALARWRSDGLGGRRGLVLVGALVLAGAPIPYLEVTPPGGALDVLLYPRLAGGWLLWASLVAAWQREPPSTR